MEKIVEALKGIEVIDAKVLKNGDLAILFDEGKILVVSTENLTFTEGTAWLSHFDSLS